MTLFPGRNLDEILPDCLTSEDPLAGGSLARGYSLPAVAEALNGEEGIPRRQYLAVTWLAHAGHLIDAEGRITFDFTDPEAAAYLRANTGGLDRTRSWEIAHVRKIRRALMGKSDSSEDTATVFQDKPMIRRSRTRTCRRCGDSLDAYRPPPQVLDPVRCEPPEKIPKSIGY